MCKYLPYYSLLYFEMHIYNYKKTHIYPLLPSLFVISNLYKFDLTYPIPVTNKLDIIYMWFSDNTNKIANNFIAVQLVYLDYITITILSLLMISSI